MSSLATPPIPPHFHEHQRLSPTRSMSAPQQQQSQSNTRKRKASPEDDEMTTSPAISNARLPQPLPAASRKRFRSNLTGRPLSVDRLLETLDKDALRSVLRTLCDNNPSIRDEVMQVSPRPSIPNTLQVLRQYHQRMMDAFPLDPNRRSDYCYDRIRPQWQDLLNALTDFTPHFLPPNEQQTTVSMQYLDGVTDIIHDLPEWDTAQYNLAKQNAYEEIAKAWSTVIKEAAKRGGGIQLQHGGWEEKVRLHNQKSNGNMQAAYDEMMSALGWLRPQSGGMQTGQGISMQARQSVRDELFGGTYGMGQQSMRSGW